MKKISLFFLTLTLSLLLLLPAASAERLDLADENFDFHTIKTLLLYDPDVQLARQNDPAGGDLVARILAADYQKEGADDMPYGQLSEEQILRKISLKLGQNLDLIAKDNPEQAQQLFAANCQDFVDAYVKTKLTDYQTGSYVVPAHTEWREIKDTDTYKDKDGKEHTITHTRQIPEYVPDTTVYTATVRLRFTVYSAKTGKEIFTRDDSRTDYHTTDLRSAYDKVVHSFFRELKKKIR